MKNLSLTIAGAMAAAIAGTLSTPLTHTSNSGPGEYRTFDPAIDLVPEGNPESRSELREYETEVEALIREIDQRNIELLIGNEFPQAEAWRLPDEM